MVTSLRFRVFCSKLICGMLLLWSFSAASAVKIDEIRLTGLTHTHPNVVLTELDLTPPVQISEEELNNAIQRVWNLNLFVQVKPSIQVIDNRHILVVELEDRWTLVPIAKFGGGGGVSFFTLGAYNPNVLGSYLELGAQYENLGGRNSFVGWFRKPQLFGNRRARVGADVWNLSRNRLFYDSKREEIGGFNTMRNRLNIFYDYFVTDFFRPGIALDIQKDETSESGLAKKTINQNADLAREVKTREDFYFLRLYATIGRQDVEEELIRGWSILPSVQYQANNSDDQLFIYKGDFLWAKSFLNRHNVAYRLSTGHNSRSSLSQDTFIGGLEHIRGLVDSQFQVTNFAFQNLEYRFPLRYSTRFTLQQVFFHDLGQLDGVKGEFLIQSLGTGFRFIFPKVYRLNIRLDFGHSYGKYPGSNVSFGLQQLF